MKYWTYEIDGKIQNLEKDTKAQAQAYADKVYAEFCGEQDPKNNQQFSDDIFLIEFSYSDELEMVVHQRIASTVDYTHYHGDKEEHGTWWI